MTRVDRLKGYYDRKRETMGLRARQPPPGDLARGARRPRLAQGARVPAADGGGRAPARRRPEARGPRPPARHEEGGDARPPAGRSAVRRLLHRRARGPPLDLRLAGADLRAVRPAGAEPVADGGVGLRRGVPPGRRRGEHVPLSPHAGGPPHRPRAGAAGLHRDPDRPGNTEVQVKTILDLRATGYVGTPSFLMAILKHAAERGQSGCRSRSPTSAPRRCRRRSAGPSRRSTAS